MSRKYQGLIVLNTKSLEGTIDDLVNSVAKEIEAEGAKVEKINNLGRRQFAYNTRHLEAGQYVDYSIEGAPDTVAKVQNRLKLNNHVYMQYFQRLA